MKSVFVLCGLIALVAGTPYDYHASVGIPLATKIREAEEAALTGSRIIGGQMAPLGEHPYMVGIVIVLAGGSVSVCGSSMLTNTKALTAAHCWVTIFSQSELFTLVFGSQYVFSGGVRVDTRDVEVHPGWDGSIAYEYDLAIVNHDHVAYTDLIQPIALPIGALETSDFIGVWAQATGYGMVGDGIPLVPTQFQSHVNLQVISNQVCSLYYPSTVTDNVLCTNGVGPSGPVGVCSSDSGGPLSIVDNGRRVLIGVVSFGSRYCEESYPSGFVRVTAHLPWIRSHL